MSNIENFEKEVCEEANKIMCVIIYNLHTIIDALERSVTSEALTSPLSVD